MHRQTRVLQVAREHYRTILVITSLQPFLKRKIKNKNKKSNRFFSANRIIYFVDISTGFVYYSYIIESFNPCLPFLLDEHSGSSPETT